MLRLYYVASIDSVDMKMDNSSIERAEEFKYLGKTLTNQILFRKKL